MKLMKYLLVEISIKLRGVCKFRIPVANLTVSCLSNLLHIFSFLLTLILASPSYYCIAENRKNGFIIFPSNKIFV
jgi:hypothetical protein